ncbi:MAG TPA: DUF885 family protein [Thermoanaerobaculia bacterium]|nr:DUF885 family protein [Thermoanaerobaculia bacterium]
MIDPRAFALLLLVAVPATANPASARSEDDPGRDELLAIHAELADLLVPSLPANGVPDLGADAVAARAAGIAALRVRLEALAPAGWSTDGQIDYLLVWSRLNAADFEHRVTRPWARDPLLYLDHVRRVPFVELPLAGDELTRWRVRLAAVPAMLEQARANLGEAAGELAGQAIFQLESFDGVGQGEPYRDDPPAGTIGWYQDLCARAASALPEILPACRDALAAVRGWRDWLRARLSSLPSSAGIGRDQLDWYLRHVRLLPYDTHDLLVLGEREYQRYRTAWEIAKNRNRALPPLALTTSAEQHAARTHDAERRIREIVAAQDLLTFPPDTPESFETDTFWSPRALTDRHFWEELQFRNALDNHIHASIPGHRFDGWLQRRVENPIRRGYGDSTRAEGWATYLEEMLVLAGITNHEPRAEELFWIALMKRASRIYAETAMHAGVFSLEQANAYLIDNVPFMEPDLGRYDLEGYLRRPGSGSGYILGKIQLEALLAERSLALGEQFSLGRFHDAVLSHGMIPLTLIRWSMTGDGAQVRDRWGDVLGLR